jgi:hypothetical protein
VPTDKLKPGSELGDEIKIEKNCGLWSVDFKKEKPIINT